MNQKFGKKLLIALVVLHHLLLPPGRKKENKMQKESLMLLEQVRDVIQQYDFPLTLRQIYYQLVAKQIIPNLQKYYFKLSRLCVIGRDKGFLSEDSFADRLREIEKVSSWINLSDFAETAKNAYRKDKWVNQDNYIEIWTEKDALRGVISPITNKWDVGLLVVRGQVSRTAIYEASQRYKQKKEEEKECYLFYFGDFDPSGLSIFNSLQNRIENFQVSVVFERIALTQSQIEQYRLPQDPAKKSDPNYKRFVEKYGDNVVELDSLPPDVLRLYVEDCIKQSLNLEKLKEILEEEKEEKKKLDDFLNSF
jgi:hypothetical protein